MANTYKTSSPTDSGSLNYHIQDVALAQGLDTLHSDLLVAKLITNYTNEAKNQGSKFASVVRVPKRGSASAQNKVPGSAITPQAVTSTQASITVNKHKTWDILVEDYGALFAQNGLLAGYLMDGAASIAEAVEADVLALGASGSRLIGSPTGGASASLIRTIKKYTRPDKWRQNQPKFIVWGAEAEADLLADTLFVQADQRGDQSGLIDGSIGRKFGFEHIVSNLAPTIAGSPGAEHAMAFQKEGLGIAFVDLSNVDLPAEMQVGAYQRAMYLNDDQGVPAYALRFIVGYDQKERGYMLTVDSVYGVGVVRSEMVYDILV